MDTYQDDVSKIMGRDVEIPILHMPQMVALALGATEKEIGLNYHVYGRLGEFSKLFEQLAKVERHLERKENQLLPYLEQYGKIKESQAVHRDEPRCHGY